VAHEVDVYLAPDGWRWRKRDGGNHKVVSSGEAYEGPGPRGAVRGAFDANPEVTEVTIHPMSGNRYTVTRDDFSGEDESNG
jgi:hypothetical protein